MTVVTAWVRGLPEGTIVTTDELYRRFGPMINAPKVFKNLILGGVVVRIGYGQFQRIGDGLTGNAAFERFKEASNG